MQDQLIATFRPELDDYLQTINQGLLELEKGITGREKEIILSDLFRAAHNIKGTSRVVGLPDIGELAHKLEDVIDGIKEEKIKPAGSCFDILFHAADTLDKMMQSHMGLSQMPFDEVIVLSELLKRILSGETLKLDKPLARPPGNALKAEGDKKPVIPKEKSDTGKKPQTNTSESIRVRTDRIDLLMDNMSELLVYQMKSNQPLMMLENIQTSMLTIQKNWRLTIPAYQSLQKSVRDSDTSQLKFQDHERLADFLIIYDEIIRGFQKQLEEFLPRFVMENNRQALLIRELQDQVKQMRMVPFANLFNTYPRTIRDLSRSLDKKIDLEIIGEQTEADRQIIDSIKDALIHLLRNATAHGIESPEERLKIGKPASGKISVQAAQKGNRVELIIQDDGKGINLDEVGRIAIERGILTLESFQKLNQREQIELIFSPYFSTQEVITNVSGRGVGLSIVRQSLEKLQGMINVETTPNQGTTFTLTLPSSLSTSHVLPVSLGGFNLGLPVSSVDRIIKVQKDLFSSIEGNPVIEYNGQPLPFFSLAQLLDLPDYSSSIDQENRTMVITGVAEKKIALIIESFEEPIEVVIKDLGDQMKRVRNIYGGTILGNGEILLILNVADLLRSAVGKKYSGTVFSETEEDTLLHSILLVDDSIATRTIEKNILENAGYHVIIATDGLEAWELLQQNPVDLIVSDVNMPRMDGFVLTEKVKQSEPLQTLPVILVTSLDKKEDRLKGMNAGADAYITKGKFDQSELLETIERILG